MGRRLRGDDAEDVARAVVLLNMSKLYTEAFLPEK